ncbi:hypothetical protein Dimus_019767 [Dionaea muscipula]
MSDLDDPLASDSEEAQNIKAESPNMAPTNPRKRLPTPVGIRGSRGEREEGEIIPPPRSDKYHQPDDPPPQQVAAASQTPEDLRGYVSRDQPGMA